MKQHDSAVSPPDRLTPVALTKKELEVVGFLSQGMNSSDISQYRCRSAETVCTHIKNARRKLGAKTIGQLIYLAMKQGLIHSIFILLMLSQALPTNDVRAGEKRRLRVARSFSARAGRVREHEV